VPLLAHDPTDVPIQVGDYSQGMEVPSGARLLFVSGRIPARPDGTVPDGFGSAWVRRVRP
jgi:2-iminobutanoate/2-iminopropanoate deaminase